MAKFWNPTGLIGDGPTYLARDTDASDSAEMSTSSARISMYEVEYFLTLRLAGDHGTVFPSFW